MQSRHSCIACIVFSLMLLSLLSGCGQPNPTTPAVVEAKAQLEAHKTSDPSSTETMKEMAIEPVVKTAAEPAATISPTDPSQPVAATDPAPVAKPAKSKRAPIYIEEPNGKELIAAALKKAKRDHKHVLVEWGFNACGWCYRLHDVFHKNEDVQPIVHEEFELVLIDEQPNLELLHEYGGKDRKYSFPHLTILDENGKVLTNQNTEPLEIGDHHDPKIVADFLKKWAPEKLDAEKLLADSLAKATSENKRVLVRIGDPYCGWCNVLAQFMQDHESVFATDYIDIKIDTERMTSGKEVAAKLNPQKDYQGRPWMVILDGAGKTIANSFGPEGNIGYPCAPAEVAHFMTMLKETRQKLTDEDLQKIEADLHAYREQQEAKKANAAAQPKTGEPATPVQ